MMDLKLVNKSLYVQAKEEIFRLITEDSSIGFMSRLPSEQELSERFGVSRNTIREAIKALENEGVLTSRHGVGTFVIRNQGNMKHNLSMLDSTTHIIASQGFAPATKSVVFQRQSAPCAIAEQLAGQKEVLYIERIRTADGEPVVYVEDYIPYREGMLEDYGADTDKPLFDFLKNYALPVAFANCSIHAVVSDEKLEDKLALGQPKALLLLQQLHYSAKGEPVLYSDSYFLTDKLEFNLIRKCLE